MTFLTSEPCYLCAEKAAIRNVGSSLLVDCHHCGAYEIEAVVTTMELTNTPALLAYLNKERQTGSVRPLIFRQLLAH